MLKNYFTTAWRNLVRQKIYTIINVTGLAFGICSCLVIYLINSYDLSFDKFHPDGNRIYRIVGEAQRSNGEKMFLNSPFSDEAGFQNQIPGFEAAVGYHLYGAKTIIPIAGKPDKKFNGRQENGGTAAGFCLSYIHRLVGFYSRRINGHIHRINNRQFPGPKSSRCKSG